MSRQAYLSRAMLQLLLQHPPTGTPRPWSLPANPCMVPFWPHVKVREALERRGLLVRTGTRTSLTYAGSLVVQAYQMGKNEQPTKEEQNNG